MTDTTPAPRSRACRVLVVDDHPDSAHSLAQWLKRLGHEPYTALDGPSALETARSVRPEVVIVDIGLPGMDGHEVAQRLLQGADASPPRVIAISGYGDENARRRSAEVGCDHHLVKPVDLQELRRLLHDALCTPS